MAGAFFSFTLIDTSAKWLAAAGLPALQVAFVRYAGNFVASLLIFLPREGLSVLRPNAPGLQLGRALMLLGSTMLNFTALSYLPLTVTTAIFFASPVLVCLLSIPLLGETVGLRRFLAILVGFSGVLIITEPWGADFHWAMFLSLGALTCASMYFVLSRMIAGRDDNPTGQIVTSGVPTLLLSPVLFFGWAWPQGVADWLAFVAMGLFATLGHSLLTVGYRYAPASTLAPMVYIQIIYVSIISWAVFRQPPDANTIAGTAVIVGAGLYIWLRERKRPPKKPVTTPGGTAGGPR
ncbi:EamA family transporter [Rhodobacteraceae bacterium 2CG4]|uniref:EamA family transporter n=2 Tax=Halovulum marinum TaxID=2662447 RepID=A0A6L5YYL0_9RHOB|nr:EamA family transporter [Halovulum marinum]